MSGGGKGGSQTTTNSIPKWVEEPAKRNLARAEEISKIGYVPYGGPEVAAFTGAQNAAFANNNATADAYGMQSGAPSMPTPETYAGGVQGYSSLPLYDEAIQQLQDTRPGQYDAIMAQFIDPFTGANPTAGAAASGGWGGQATGGWRGSIADGSGYTGRAEFNPHSQGQGGSSGGASGGGAGGYNGIGDMFDGGGPGASGGAYSGGGRISDVANGVTGNGPGGGGVK